MVLMGQVLFGMDVVHTHTLLVAAYRYDTLLSTMLLSEWNDTRKKFLIIPLCKCTYTGQTLVAISISTG